MFIYDLVIASLDTQLHVHHLQAVFDRLRAAKLKLKASKCDFGKRQIRFLGYVIPPEGIISDPIKVKAIVDMPAPINLKGIHSFLEMVNYYSKTIPAYGELTEPLLQLTRNYANVEWGEC